MTTTAEPSCDGVHDAAAGHYRCTRCYPAIGTSFVRCPNCSEDLGPKQYDHTGNPLYDDGAKTTCTVCHAVCQFGIGDDYDLPEDDDETHGYAYVQFWWCAHGKADDEPCDRCEVEAGAGVGEASA